MDNGKNESAEKSRGNDEIMITLIKIYCLGFITSAVCLTFLLVKLNDSIFYEVLALYAKKKGRDLDEPLLSLGFPLFACTVPLFHWLAAVMFLLLALGDKHREEALETFRRKLENE